MYCRLRFFLLSTFMYLPACRRARAAGPTVGDGRLDGRRTGFPTRPGFVLQASPARVYRSRICAAGAAAGAQRGRAPRDDAERTGAKAVRKNTYYTRRGYPVSRDARPVVACAPTPVRGGRPRRRATYRAPAWMCGPWAWLAGRAGALAPVRATLSIIHDSVVDDDVDTGHSGSAVTLHTGPRTRQKRGRGAYVVHTRSETRDYTPVPPPESLVQKLVHTLMQTLCLKLR